MKRVVFLESAARTASGTGNTVTSIPSAKQLVVLLDVTAASGTSPTLDVTIQDSVDGSQWHTVSSFAQKVGAGQEVLRISNPFSRLLRVSYTVGGTSPSFTFKVEANAKE